MRIMMMHKADRFCEGDVPPPPKLVEEMGALMGEMVQAGVLLGGEGLRPSALGVRLRFAGGRRSQLRGPFIGDNELPAGFTIVRVPTLDAAVDWATRYAAVVGDAEIDVSPVAEPWDIGVCPKPEGLATTRYMLLHKADRDSEAGVLPGAAQQAALAELRREMVRAGVFVTAENLQASAKGVRLHYSGGRRTVTDGPFTESKELIAGYCLCRLESLAQAMQWSVRFAAVVGDVEIDIRPVLEPPNPG